MGECVSVIIPNLNDGDTLGRAVQSVRDCAVGTEVIIVDNSGGAGSLGDTVIECQPQPPGHNRNAGLDVASGRYIQFLDADDELLELGKRVKALQDGHSVAVGAEERVSEVGDVETLYHGQPIKACQEYLVEAWVPAIGCMLCKRGVFHEHQFDERFYRAQDFHLWARIFAEYDVSYVHTEAFRYNLSGGRAGLNHFERYDQQRKICQDLLKRYPTKAPWILRRWIRATSNAFKNL